MQLDARMIFQELFDLLRFVSGKIVQNDMSLLLALCRSDHLLEEGDEFIAGMPRRRFAVNLAGSDVQRRVQGKRAVAVVFKSVLFDPAGGERKYRIQAIEGLNRGFLVQAEYRRVLRRIEVKAEDVGGFRLEIRIVAGHVAL